MNIFCYIKLHNYFILLDHISFSLFYNYNEGLSEKNIVSWNMKFNLKGDYPKRMSIELKPNNM